MEGRGGAKNVGLLLYAKVKSGSVWTFSTQADHQMSGMLLLVSMLSSVYQRVSANQLGLAH